MDRRIETRVWTGKRLTITALTLALLAAVAALLVHLSTPRLRVERDKVTLSTVRQGPFQEVLLWPGEVQAADGQGFLVRAAVDREDAPRVRPGQQGRTEIDGAACALTVTTLHPEDTATLRTIAVDLRFAAPPPAGLQAGRPVWVRLPLGEPAPAILLDRGAFFQATGGHWVFVAGTSGTAVKRTIRLGRQSPEVHEVLSGLAPGEQVITSSYDTFGDAEELVLTPWHP
jgi:HlyD family secretion protein